ncbi:hypothetical protein [Leptothoe sp. PORK10 BA2]|uniref:hypothetical protein n=1 Tax=Leptothoe sp. PORK10 BA2 TaxID=3110254 RepID=UPI002B1F0C9F|nr:hypothetical protein [Leptothoe sp. PORK10 BA2]MEA5466845.1 hypothetical protein [Leptothoe sp. PORK10 BA2]
MADPVTLTVGSIAALAFTKFLESSAGEAAKQLTPAVLDKIDTLRQAIWAKLRGIPEVDALKVTVEKGGPVSEQQVQLLTPYLDAAMKADPAFAQELRQLASEINQEINIQQGSGGEVWNVIGKAEKNEFIDNKAPIIKDNTGTINISYGQPPA